VIRGPRPRPAAEPGDALRALAGALREEGSVISPHAVEPEGAEPSLGLLVAAGPRADEAPGEYALVIESVREGYLLHYAEGRVVRGADPDLALLAGDYLYALGLERLAALGDLEAVRELSDLISLAAQVHDGGRAPEAAARAGAALWLADATAIGAGASAAHERAKADLRRECAAATEALWAAASATAAEAGLVDELGRAADAIDFPVPSIG
jgi:hypothetical protein